MFKIGDRVEFGGCPFDEQIPGELARYESLKNQIHKVIEVMSVDDPGTTGQWIKTDLMSEDWIDKAWFFKSD